LSMQVDYCNFKDTVHKRRDQKDKHSAYLSVWSAMLRVQHKEDSLYKTNQQPYFIRWAAAWGREMDSANGRFDEPEPEPTKTIRSVLAEKQELEDRLKLIK